MIAVSIAVLAIPFFNQAAQAVDPRAEVPGATITGVILDAGGHNIPNATVTLYRDGQLFDVPGNPQQSNSVADLHISIGRYQFNRLSRGQYLVVASVPDAAGNLHEANLSVNVDAGTITADVVIPDLVCVTTGTPSPVPVSTAIPTPYHEPCGLGFILPVMGISALMIYKMKNR